MEPTSRNLDGSRVPLAATLGSHLTPETGQAQVFIRDTKENQHDIYRPLSKYQWMKMALNG